MEGVWAVVVAAGRGERLGLGYNKALHVLSGRSVIARTTCRSWLMNK